MVERELKALLHIVLKLHIGRGSPTVIKRVHILVLVHIHIFCCIYNTRNVSKDAYYLRFHRRHYESRYRDIIAFLVLKHT